MNQHPYLRAYMAGITVPTVFLLVAMTAFTFARYVYNVPVPIERVIVFPMAVVPNLWGVWNILWVLTRRRISIGLFGAILPILFGFPAGVLITHLLQFSPPDFVPIVMITGLPVGVMIYYLAWKYLVASLNRVLGLTD